MRKDLDHFHCLLHLKSFFGKNKSKKTELAAARQAFMEFGYESVLDLQSQDLPQFLVDCNVLAQQKGVEHCKFMLPSTWEPPVLPPVALEGYKVISW